jgi:hypothetical protein
MGPAVVGCGGSVPLVLIMVAVAVAVTAIGVGVGRGGMGAVAGVIIGTAVVGPRGVLVHAVIPIVYMTSGTWGVCWIANDIAIVIVKAGLTGRARL